MLAKRPADRWPTLSAAAEALIDGLGANDAQMRKEMSVLVRAMPEENVNAFPQTPHSPTPAIMTAAAGASPVPTPARPYPGVSTEIMAQLVQDETPLAATAVTPKAKRNLVPPLLATAAVVAVLALIYSFVGDKGAATSKATDAANAATTATANAAATAAFNDSLDRSDTTVVRLGVNPITVTLAVGDSTQLKALAFGPSGESVRRPVQWSSSDTTAVRVNADGWIRAITKTKPNSPVFITATAAKKSSVSVVNVK
jgi:hypothetical protein